MPPAPKKKVAIIGAGPGGLVSAKKLLQTRKLEVTIFEQNESVGGLWARGNLINPDMQTNFCMFTVAFSDLGWGGVPLSKSRLQEDGKNKARRKKIAPIYPKAWMVERYLEVYAERYSLMECLRSNTRVVKVEREFEKLKITSIMNWKNEKSLATVEYFDYLVVATGYLSKPKVLDCHLDDDLIKKPQIPLLHSTEYRTIRQLRINQEDPVEKYQTDKVLIVGGSHSGSEIATLVALQHSNERWAPSSSSINPRTSRLEIIHVTSHKMLAVPAFGRNYFSPTLAFEPFEFRSCNRATKPPTPLTHSFGLTNAKESFEVEMSIEGFIHGEVKPGTLSEIPAYAVVSETYDRFVNEGIIRPVVGSLKSLSTEDSGKVKAIVQSGHETLEIGEVTAVINATGFDSCGSLDFLSQDIKEELGFDQSSTRLPLILDSSYMSQRSSASDMAFLGFTGVNWGVMEMQARAFAMKWTSDISTLPEEEALAKNIEAHICRLRQAIHEGRKSEVPQCLFGDYMGLMEQGYRELKLERVDGGMNQYAGMLCPARFIDPGSLRTEAEDMVMILEDTERKVKEERLFLARAVFLGLAGNWTQEGEESTIEFHSRHATDDAYEFEYVVVEHTTKSTNSTSIAKAVPTVLRYDDLNDNITGWSVRSDDDLCVDRQIFELRFNSAPSSSDPNSCNAVVYHTSTSQSFHHLPLRYSFDFKGSNMVGLHIDGVSADGKSYTLDFIRPLSWGKFPIHSCMEGTPATDYGSLGMEQRLDRPYARRQSWPMISV